MHECDECGAINESVKLMPCGDHWHYLCGECRERLKPIADKPQ